MVCVLTANAQTFTDRLQTSSAGDGSVRVTQSDDISALVNGKINVAAEAKPGKETTTTKPAATDKKPAATDKTASAQTRTGDREDESEETAAVDTSKKVIKNAQKVTGYRVQVFTGGNSRADKTKAESIGDQIKRLFPDQPVYVHFYSPRWICRMGNYRTYEEGQAMLVRVRAAGFTQASLVKGTITPTD